MYGPLTYIYLKNQPNVGRYTIHGMVWDMISKSRVVVCFYFKDCFDAKCGAMGVILLVGSCVKPFVWPVFFGGCQKGVKKAGTGIEMLIPRCFGYECSKNVMGTWLPFNFLGAHWIKMTTECLSFFLYGSIWLMKPYETYSGKLS